MTPEARRDWLICEAQRFGWALEPEQATLLLLYLERIQDENKRVNVTAVRDFEVGLLRHLLDSLALGLHLDERRIRSHALRMLDLGTGGGFPGVVAAIACPESLVHLVESRRKKLDAVGRALEPLGIKNVAFHHSRLRDLSRASSPFSRSIDVVLARGVGALAEIVNESARALVPGTGTLVCWKSASLDEQEQSESKSAADEAGLEALPEIPYVSFKPCVLVRYLKTTES